MAPVAGRYGIRKVGWLMLQVRTLRAIVEVSRYLRQEEIRLALRAGYADGID